MCIVERSSLQQNDKYVVCKCTELLEMWKPWSAWLHAIESDLQPANVGLYSAWRRAQGGVVALLVEYRTCDQEVVGSSLGRARGVKTLGMFLTPVCLCSPSSISWYWPKGGDALWLGSKGRYGLCVGGRQNCVIPLLHTAISERFEVVVHYVKSAI